MLAQHLQKHQRYSNCCVFKLINVPVINFSLYSVRAEHICCGGTSFTPPHPHVDTHSELAVQLECEQRIGKLPEVQLAQGTHTVDVLEVHFLCKVRARLRAEFLPAHTQTHTHS